MMKREFFSLYLYIISLGTVTILQLYEAIDPFVDCLCVLCAVEMTSILNHNTTVAHTNPFYHYETNLYLPTYDNLSLRGFSEKIDIFITHTSDEIIQIRFSAENYIIRRQCVSETNNKNDENIYLLRPNQEFNFLVVDKRNGNYRYVQLPEDKINYYVLFFVKT